MTDKQWANENSSAQDEDLARHNHLAELAKWRGAVAKTGDGSVPELNEDGTYVDRDGAADDGGARGQ